MLEKFLSKTKFDSYEDFMQNFKVNVPENFNFGYDVVDEWARTNPDKPALLWTNEQGEKIQFTFADIKRESDKAASFFTSLGIGRGDMVMLILKRRYQFWFSIIALHKIGATTIPATHLLTAKDIVYRCQSADIKAIVAVGDDIVLKHIDDALPKCPSLKYRISTGPHIPDGWLDFNKGCAEAAPFALDTCFAAYELRGARALAVYENGEFAGMPAITERRLGKGRVIVLGGVPSPEALLRLVGLAPVAQADENIVLVERSGKCGGIIALETQGVAGTVTLGGEYTDLLSGKKFSGETQLAPYSVLVLQK